MVTAILIEIIVRFEPHNFYTDTKISSCYSANLFLSVNIVCFGKQSSKS